MMIVMMVVPRVRHSLIVPQKGTKGIKDLRTLSCLFVPFVANLKRSETEGAVELAVEFVVLAERDFHDLRQLFDVSYVYDCVDVV